MSEENQMSPDASPIDLSKKSGVRRVNNIPVYIAATLLCIFFLIIVMVASNRADKQKKHVEVESKNAKSSAAYVKEIIGDREAGIIPDGSELPAPKIGAGVITVARPDNLEAPPKPPVTLVAEFEENQNSGDLQRVRMMKLQQLEEAIKAKTAIQATPSRSPGSPIGGVANNGGPITREEALARMSALRQQADAQSDDTTAAYKARLQELQAAGLIGGAGAGASTAPRLLNSGTSGGNKDYAQFDSTDKEDRWQLNTQPEAPKSPYELRAGFVIPATLISGINSDLPGQIMAQTSQDIYDTATGKWKLIPQGSRLVGRYSSEVAYGQSRVLIAWQRIVFPDGKAMDIGSMPGADSTGYSGFNDQVNNHYMRLFGSAFLMSAVTAGITYSQGRNQQQFGSNAPTASSALSEALGQQLGQVTAQLIAKNMNIAPTLEIRPGYRFNVVVTKDMVFSKPYRSFDY